MDIPDSPNTVPRHETLQKSGAALIFISVVGILFFTVTLVPFSDDPEPISITIPASPDAFSTIAIEAKAAIVYDLLTNETLYAKNSESQLPLASLTKLLTVYAAVREFPQTNLVTVSADASRHQVGIHTFAVGHTLTLADMARLTLTGSLNDGAAALAEMVSKSFNVSQEASLASVASALELSQTYAVNGSGLDMNAAISGGYGSAHDVAVLAGALTREAPSIAYATTLTVAKGTATSGKSFAVKNTNPIVNSIPGLLLSKTGYTELAGGNLVLVFDSGINHPIAVVVLGSTVESRFTDSVALMDATRMHFSNIATQ